MTDLRTLLCNLVVGSAAVAAAAMLAACGTDTIYGSDTGPTMDVRGNLADVFPLDTGREIVVFVYTTKDTQVDCEHPAFPEEGTQYQSRKLDPGETEFEVRNAKAGHITIVFLLDNEGHDADGKIDPGDPIAILNDPDCILADVPNKYIAFTEDVDVNFALTQPSGFPAPGRADAADIHEEHE